MSADNLNAVNLILVGRTGNGKSSTGNSIIGRKVFTVRGSSSVATYDIREAAVTIGNKTVTVVDGPGIGDTDTDKTDDGQSMLELVHKTLSLISYRFNALLFFLKYGVRFTKQEKDAVTMIRTIFGEDVLKNYGVVVMTYGDSFDLDTEDEKITFEDWCREQTGDFKNLLIECDYRCVLFNNMSKVPSKINEQRQELMRIVTVISSYRKPYDKEDFKKAKPGQNKLLVISKLQELEAQTEQFLNKIEKDLYSLQKNSIQDPARNTIALEQISNELQRHVSFLEMEDQDTGSINHLLTKISIFQLRIKTLTDLNNLKKLQQKGKWQQFIDHLTSNKKKYTKYLLGFAFVSLSMYIRNYVLSRFSPMLIPPYSYPFWDFCGVVVKPLPWVYGVRSLNLFSWFTSAFFGYPWGSWQWIDIP